MNISLPQRIALILLSALLLAGALILHVRHSRPLCKISVVNGVVERELTLAQTVKMLKEARKVDPNTASAEELISIPGIGPGLASRIVEYRDKGNAFLTYDDLTRIPGIGPKKLEKMREYVKFK